MSDLKSFIEGVVITGGSGWCRADSWDDPVRVAIVHGGGSYTPAGVIVIGDGSEDHVLQEAMDEYEESFKSQIAEYEKEIYQEALKEGESEEKAGETAYEQAREGMDGATFTTTAKELYLVLQEMPKLQKYLDLEINLDKIDKASQEMILESLTETVETHLKDVKNRFGVSDALKEFDTTSNGVVFYTHTPGEEDETRIEIQAQVMRTDAVNIIGLIDKHVILNDMDVTGTIAEILEDLPKAVKTVLDETLQYYNDKILEPALAEKKRRQSEE